MERIVIDVSLTGIEILHFFQDIRGSVPDFITTVFNFLTEWHVLFSLLLVSLLIWFVDKRAGQIVGIAFTGSIATGVMLKNIICQPRPWKLDDTIVPVGTKETSYSLPSSHTTSSVASYGTAAFLVRNRYLAVFCLIVAVLIPFTRIYLEHHTPLDILAGVLVAAGVSLLVWWAFKHFYDDDHRYYLMLLAAVILLAVITVIVYCQKPSDVLKYAPFAFVFLVGFFLERRYVRYEPLKELPLLKKTALFLAGSVVTVVGYYVVLRVNCGNVWDCVLSTLVGFWISLVYPYLLHHFFGTE